MPDTCENWFRFVYRCVYYVRQTREIYQVLPYSVDFEVFEELWNTLSMTVLNKYSFVWNYGPVNIWNERKSQTYFERRTYI